MGNGNTARNYGWTSTDMIDKGAALAGQAGNSAQMWEKIAGATIMSPAGFVLLRATGRDDVDQQVDPAKDSADAQ